MDVTVTYMYIDYIPWVSKKMYCVIYIVDDATSRQQHENGLRKRQAIC